MSLSGHTLILMLLILSGSWCFGQTSVNGHVCAEVVESVSVSCQGNTTMTYLTKSQDELDLGRFNILAEASSTITLVFDNDNIKNNRGEIFAIETTHPDTGEPLVTDLNGYQSLNLMARTTEQLTTGQYQGNYRVTFAYN
ncbi:MAG: hypothetical protein IPH20_16045 [Bacteroidales bacterium]|nr:hypothetical protein [Bacteroidales bacterium]